MAKKIYTDEEARERKNARQREYAKRTGYAANVKYDKNTYDRVVLNVRKEIAEAYKAKCKEKGISYSEPLHEAVKKFLEM